MNKYLLSILLSVSILACERYPEPGNETLKQLNFQILGTGQSAEANHYFSDSIGIIINQQSVIPAGDWQFVMELEVMKGGGHTDQTIVYADSAGIMKTQWRAGDESNEQMVKATIYDTRGVFSTETEIHATAWLPGKWNTITSGYLTKIHDMVVDTVNNRTLMGAGCNLYELDGKFYDWKKYPEESNLCFSHIEMNSREMLFAEKSPGLLYKSDDWGKHWIYVGKPIPGNDHTFRLNITPDDYIWVSKWDHGIRCSKDDGVTWQRDTTGLAIDEEMNDVYMLGDGSHLSLSLNQLKILRTFDDGITWMPINTPEYSLSFYVTENDEIIAYNQDYGFAIHKSTDYGESYKRVFSSQTEFTTFPMTNIFKKFEDFYYFVAPGKGVYKTKNFENYDDFELILEEPEARHIHIDHEGNIYVSSFTGETAFILAN